ncbi:Prevent-host-death family protein [Candidatus Competibacter denitrificans Run_A_D11]|uniref:Prevent-host-death family protein n=1 Tax=Candidatus Competibacter denitrificans Run_A_D11 TaxID=1400863 RepID=W6MBM8_9GAMM|nr:type II toxin-antitoxin system Phd/YefM family antitoxin [Candidatus Competibacter denitrificans]CDI01408.1 Prevent-host-death family protein [Candidatus Competibacter denitrificans Run_A_D11]HAS85787.1 type II toxin-antitoxin system Phd/YefM family antitoxin [Candidatus Competibacteraceae bacterium]HRC70347.1 type II toxin-antitoxin system Phd/YefM family antitoxin [Candidatus Competibacter denitrificans]
MKVYSYSQARQQLSELLDSADNEEVLIQRRDGSSYLVIPKPVSTSPFAVSGIKTQVSTQDILEAIGESRKHGSTVD